MRYLSWLPAIISILLPVAVPASEWAQFLGPTGNSISPEKIANKSWNENPPKMLWSIPLSDDGYAGPSTAGGKVFIVDHMGAENIVKALDIKTGKIIWTFNYPDAEKPNYGYTRSTPVVSAGRVYILGRFGEIFCLNTKNGEKIWSRNICTEFAGKLPIWHYSMSPLIDGNKLILCPGGPNAAMVALDKTTGKTIWQGGGSDLPGYATPHIAVINRQRQYIVFTGLSMIGVDAANGNLLWSLPWKSGYDINSAAAQVIGDTIFLTSGSGHGCALIKITDNKPAILWENKAMKCLFSSPVYSGGYVYGVSEPGELVCINRQDGTSRWKQVGFDFGALIAVDGVLIAFDGKGGDLFMVQTSPDSYQQLGKFTPLGGQSWTAPIISNGNLIVRNKSALACFSLK